MSRGTGLGRFERYLLGNVHREGVEFCADAVRKRALYERKSHGGVTMFVTERGDVYAPGSEGPNAMFVTERFPKWIVARYQFAPPAPKSSRAEINATMPRDGTMPTVQDIADDIVFHVGAR